MTTTRTVFSIDVWTHTRTCQSLHAPVVYLVNSTRVSLRPSSIGCGNGWNTILLWDLLISVYCFNKFEQTETASNNGILGYIWTCNHILLYTVSCMCLILSTLIMSLGISCILYCMIRWHVILYLAPPPPPPHYHH